MKPLAQDKRTFIILWLACIIGALTVLPSIFTLFPNLVDSYGSLFLVVVIESVIIYGIILWLSYILLKKVDLDPFACEDPKKQVLYPGVLWGLIVGIFIFACDKLFFMMPGMVHPPAWAGLLASFHGGINEEVMARLLFFTLVYFLLRRVFKEEGKRKALLWATTAIVAVGFGAARLPMLFQLSAGSTGEIAGIFLLNSIAGIVYGWLYWSRGLWAAMLAHFISDFLVQFVLVGLL